MLIFPASGHSSSSETRRARHLRAVPDEARPHSLQTSASSRLPCATLLLSLFARLPPPAGLLPALGPHRLGFFVRDVKHERPSASVVELS